MAKKLKQCAAVSTYVLLIRSEVRLCVSNIKLIIFTFRIKDIQQFTSGYSSAFMFYIGSNCSHLAGLQYLRFSITVNSNLPLRHVLSVHAKWECIGISAPSTTVQYIKLIVPVWMVRPVYPGITSFALRESIEWNTFIFSYFYKYICFKRLLILGELQGLLSLFNPHT